MLTCLLPVIGEKKHMAQLWSVRHRKTFVIRILFPVKYFFIPNRVLRETSCLSHFVSKATPWTQVNILMPAKVGQLKLRITK